MTESAVNPGLGAGNWNQKYVFPVLLVATACSFFYPSFGVSNIMIILLSASWLATGNFGAKWKAFRQNKTALLFCSIPLIYLLSLAWSSNTSGGASLLEKKALLILFPLILSTVAISRELVHKLLIAFVITTFVASLLPLLAGKFDYVANTEDVAVMRFRDIFMERVGMDVPYFALYIDLAIIFIVYLLYVYRERKQLALKIAGVVLMAGLLALNVFLSARMPLIALLILGGVAYLFLIKRYPLYGIISLVVILSIGVTAFLKVGFINARFKEIFTTEWQPPVGIHFNSTNLRVGTYTCSAELLKSQWLFGMGVGDVQPALDDCYKTKGYSDVMYMDSYNPHNEYINIWLNTGVLGMLLFVAALMWPLRNAIVAKDYLLAAFLGLMILSFATECILERQKGIYLFAFFNSLLAFALPPAKTNKINEAGS